MDGSTPPPPPPPPSSSSKCEKIIAEEELRMDLIKAAMDGNVGIFDESNLSGEHLFRKSVEEFTILHIAIRYEGEVFVKEFLERYSPTNKLITERDYQGNTPLHVAAEVGNENIVEMIYDYMKNCVESHDHDYKKLLRAKNSKGNTALHVAILYHKYPVADNLLQEDPHFARIVNESKEAPLHLAITQLVDDVQLEILISDLLEKASCVASWRDAKGLTPLLRAAALHPPFNLKITKEIIRFSPLSTLVFDVSGKSILHLLIDKVFSDSEIEDLFCHKEICILRNHQDHDGNTPLDIALKCNNIKIVKVLSGSSHTYHIRNSDDIGALSTIQQEDLNNQPLQQLRRMKEKESSSAYMGDIKLLLERSRLIGAGFFGSQDSEGCNFVHILMNKTAIRNYFSSFKDCEKFLEFIRKILIHSPMLVCQKDLKRNTPVHILAQNKAYPTLLKPNFFSELLSICANAITKVESRGMNTNKDGNHALPWVEQNADGNTPLHEAIIANNNELVLELLAYSDKLACKLDNQNKETPLHLLAGTGIAKGEFKDEEIMKVVNANLEALGSPDKDGLIPMARAIKAENLSMVVTLISNAEHFGSSGDQTFYQKFRQLLLEHSSTNFVNELLQNDTSRKILKQKDRDGSTLLHLAIEQRHYNFVENILQTWGSGGQQSENNQRLLDLIKIPDKDGLTPILRALKVGNLVLATRLCSVTPEAAEIGDIDGKTIWHHLPKHPSYESKNVKDLLQIKALRKILEKKDKSGDTTLHLAIQEKYFGFLKDLLKASKSRSEPSSDDDQWLVELFRIQNNVGETPEYLLAELPILSDDLEKTILNDHRMRGIRSSWSIPRSQLQNYMNSMNVIAALQTTITFTAAFTVPGGLIQDIGTPILIRSPAFQVFIIADVIAMCLSMMVLICLLWMVATNKRDSVMIQDLALSLLLASFIATLLTFMSGVYVTISPVKPWIAISTLVLCCLFMLFFHRFMLTKLLFLFKYHKFHLFKKMCSWLADSSNT